VRLPGSLGRVAVVATTLVAVTVLPGAPSFAHAGGCSAGHGVSVVVEFNELGGHDVRTCDADGGDRTAARLFEDSGLALAYVQRQPGFVCRVAGLPAQDPCVNTPPDDAYWSLWWSDGSSAAWHYATTGVGTLTVPDGGSVALAWDGRSGDVKPSASPRANGGAAPAATEHARTPARGERTDGGLPTWVAPAAIALLAAAGAGTAVVRRRRGTPGP